MLDCHPVNVPLVAGTKYSCANIDDITPDEISFMKTVPYANTIGSLQYLVTMTQWDITFLVNHLAQFMSNPAPKH
jgi:hypothetical protein